LKIKNLLLALATLLIVFTTAGGSVFAASEEWICADSLSASAVDSTLPTTLIPSEFNSNPEYQDLAGKFRSGKFELYDLGTYVQYLVETLIYFAGGISVLFVVIGGYKYMIGGMSDDKEAGKKTIMYALAGLVVVALAWSVVNAIQVFVTTGNEVASPTAITGEQWVCADSVSGSSADTTPAGNADFAAAKVKAEQCMKDGGGDLSNCEVCCGADAQCKSNCKTIDSTLDTSGFE
jgi:hypothetical protein